MLPISFYQRDALTVAPELLGCELVYSSSEGIMAGIIVETEAYTQDDPASHAYQNRSKRNEVMFGPGGRAYVYNIYGLHQCLNVVTGTEEHAEAVLIRALEPTQGLATMRQRRKQTDITQLTNGPAKLVQALGISLNQYGASFTSPQLHIMPRLQRPAIKVGPRIGITKGLDLPWRFFIANNPFVSLHTFNKHSLDLPL